MSDDWGNKFFEQLGKLEIGPKIEKAISGFEYTPKRREPILGDYEAALAADPATESELGDVDACVCYDDNGNQLNQCNECPR